ncbi:MAG: T9SS type A sorting domain-containing protein [Bacteroidia bacterium]
MKKSLLFLSLFAGMMAVLPTNAQTIPNADFETWSGGVPAGWMAPMNSPPTIVTITQSSDFYSGTSSVKFNTVTLASTTYPALLEMNPLPTTSKPAYLNGWIKASLASTDTFIAVGIFHNSVTSTSGAGIDYTSLSRASWSPFHVTINYPAGFTPDSFSVYFKFSGLTTSSVLIDALSFSNTPIGNELGNTVTTGVKNITSVSANSFVTPNPVNGNSRISFALNSGSAVTISVYDLTGRFIKTVLNETFTAGVHEVPFNTNDLQSGIYFYTLSGDGISEMKKFVVNK